MRTYNKIGLLILLTLAAQVASASGQRTTLVTEEAIEAYRKLTLSGETINEPVLHYVGSVGQSGHLLMVTKTSYPKKVEVEPGVFRVRGRPWDHVFKYFVSADKMTIINGWDISERMKNEGFEVRPSYCPRIVIRLGQKKYHINPNAEIKSACMKMRRVRHKFQKT